MINPKIKNKTKERNLEEKVEELYSWYKSIKFFSKIWESVTSLTLIGLVIFIILLISSLVRHWVFDSFNKSWRQVSIDTKFIIGFSLITFILGIIVGKIKK